MNKMIMGVHKLILREDWIKKLTKLTTIHQVGLMDKIMQVTCKIPIIITSFHKTIQGDSMVCKTLKIRQM